MVKLIQSMVQWLSKVSWKTPQIYRAAVIKALVTQGRPWLRILVSERRGTVIFLILIVAIRAPSLSKYNISHRHLRIRMKITSRKVWRDKIWYTKNLNHKIMEAIGHLCCIKMRTRSVELYYRKSGTSRSQALWLMGGGLNGLSRGWNKRRLKDR